MLERARSIGAEIKEMVSLPKGYPDTERSIVILQNEEDPKVVVNDGIYKSEFASIAEARDFFKNCVNVDKEAVKITRLTIPAHTIGSIVQVAALELGGYFRPPLFIFTIAMSIYSIRAWERANYFSTINQRKLDSLNNLNSNP